MAYTPLTHVSAGSTDQNNITTGSIDTTGANLLVLARSRFVPGGAVTISDNKSNTWSARTAFANATQEVQLYYCVNPIVGTGHTFTASSTGGFPAVAVQAFSGATGTPYDTEVGANTAGATTLQPGSLTPGLNNEVVLSACGFGGTVSGVSAMTLAENVAQVGGQHIGVGLAYVVQTAAAAVNPTWSFTGSIGAAATSASFKTGNLGNMLMVL